MSDAKRFKQCKAPFDHLLKDKDSKSPEWRVLGDGATAAILNEQAERIKELEECLMLAREFVGHDQIKVIDDEGIYFKPVKRIIDEVLGASNE